IATTLVPVEAARAHVHAARIQELVAQTVEWLVRGADQALRGQRPKARGWKPALHVHAVTGEENAKALDGLRLLGLQGAGGQRFQERQAEHHATKAAQEAASRDRIHSSLLH